MSRGQQVAPGKAGGTEAGFGPWRGEVSREGVRTGQSQVGLGRTERLGWPSVQGLHWKAQRSLGQGARSSSLGLLCPTDSLGEGLVGRGQRWGRRGAGDVLAGAQGSRRWLRPQGKDLREALAGLRDQGHLSCPQRGMWV